MKPIIRLLKMSAKNILISVLFILLIMACSEEPNKVAKETFNRQSFPDSSHLAGEYIPFNKPIHNPLSFYISKDSLLVVVKGKGDPYYIEIYNLNNKKLLQKIAKRGRGPNEFLSVSFRDKKLIDNTFYLRDVIKSQLSFYNFDSILNGNTNPLYRIEVPRYTHDCHILNTDTLVCFNHYYFEKKQFKNHVKPLFFINRNTNIQSDKNLIGKYYVANVNSSFVYISPVNNNIFLFNRHIDNFKIFNKKLELKRNIEGPENLNPKYELKTNNHVSFKEGFYQSYPGICTTDSAIFALFNPIRRDQANKSVEIFKFDWDGNFIHRYKLDKYIYTISVDSKGKYLYGSHFEENLMGDPKLIRYKLK